MGLYDANGMRLAIKDMVERCHPNTFITFSFNHPHKAARYPVGRHPGWHPVPPQAVLGRVTDFFDKLVESVGRGFVPGGLAFGFFENPRLNPHIHVLANLNNPQFDWVSGVGNARWRSLSNQGQLYVKEIEDASRVISYCTKRFGNQEAFENMFLY